MPPKLKVMRAFVSSYGDYCDSLLYGMSVGCGERVDHFAGTVREKGKKEVEKKKWKKKKWKKKECHALFSSGFIASLPLF